MVIIFDLQGVTITLNNEMIITDKFLNNLIGIIFTLQKPIMNLRMNQSINFKLWHDRLGHVSNHKFVQMRQNQLVDGKEVLYNIRSTTDICESCIYGK